MSIYDKASLVLIPSGTKTSKVYSQKPTNGDGDFTFSRSTAATRVNASGNIEKETQNLLLQSNTFDTTWINNLGGAVTGGQAGYDGTNDAWEINKNTTSFRRIEQSGLSLSGIWTLSVYAKAGTLDVIALRNFVGGDRAEFNLTSGTITNQGGGTIIARSMTDVGNGWYRCSITCNSTSTQIQIYVDWNQTIGGNIYIQDAQLEQGLVARDYIETTTTAIYGGITDNVPRLDYTDSSCPALLLEPQRTNLVRQSEYFGIWTNVSSNPVDVVDNHSLSPEGKQNAAKLTFNGINSWKASPSLSVTQQTYTGSIYLKVEDGGADFSAVLSMYVTGGGVRQDVNITITSEWQRFEAVFDNWTIGTGATYFVLRSNTDGRSCLAYGAQVEAGSYATSYIPTYGSAVTRNEEDLDTTYANAFATNGSVTCYFELDAAPNTNTNTISPNLAQYFASGDYITYNHNGAGRHRIRIWANSTSSYITGSVSQDEEAKIAVTATSTSASIFINGSLIQSVTIDGDWASANQFNTLLSEAIGVIPLKQYMLFPTALTDQEAIDLTTL